VRHADGFAAVPCDAQSAFVLQELELLPASGVVPASGDALLKQMPSLVAPDWPIWTHDSEAGQLGELIWQSFSQWLVVPVLSSETQTKPAAHAAVVQSPPSTRLPVGSQIVNSKPDWSAPIEQD
jgi:hypothetical protein